MYSTPTRLQPAPTWPTNRAPPGRAGPPRRMAADQGADPKDVLNILVASDIHLGYNERDAIRGQDSFNTLEE
eukprot:3551565-Prymnesium_polylepis.1